MFGVSAAVAVTHSLTDSVIRAPELKPKRIDVKNFSLCAPACCGLLPALMTDLLSEY